MVCGDIPFETDSEIKRAYLQFREAHNLSEDVKDLIRSCLTISVTDRISLIALSKHRWMKPPQTFEERPSLLRAVSAPVQVGFNNSNVEISNSFINQLSNESEGATYMEICGTNPLPISLDSDSSHLGSQGTSFESVVSMSGMDASNGLFVPQRGAFLEVPKVVYGKDQNLACVSKSDDEECFFTVEQISPSVSMGLSPDSVPFSGYSESHQVVPTLDRSFSPLIFLSDDQASNDHNLSTVSQQSSPLPSFSQIKYDSQYFTNSVIQSS
jgi:serine/threonine protein kinase